MFAKRKLLAAPVGVLAAVVSIMAQANGPAAQPYTWKSVQIVGGGFVDGIVFHPTAKGVRYARTAGVSTFSTSFVLIPWNRVRCRRRRFESVYIEYILTDRP